MTSTVSFDSESIDTTMEGNLEVLDFDRGYRIRIDGEDVAEMLELTFEQIPHDLFDPSGEFGKFRVMFEKVEEKT